MDTIAADDRRLPPKRIERIRRLRPDMILPAAAPTGGRCRTGGVGRAHRRGAARVPLGQGFDLPIIYAGNAEAQGEIRRILAGTASLQVVDNLRPVLERENLGPPGRDPRAVSPPRDGAGARLPQAHDLDHGAGS